MASTGALAVTEAGDTLAGSGARAWTPADLTVPPALWYDAAAPQTITLNGAAVAQLNDRGLSGFNLVQATGTRQPAYSAASFNGRPGIQFDGAGDVLARTGTPSAGLFGAGGTRGTLFVAGRYTSGVVWFKWQSADTNRFNFEGAARWDYPSDAAGTGQFNTFTGFSPGANTIMAYVADGTARRVWKNGTLSLNTGSIPAGIASASGNLSIGADSGGANSANFLLGEAVLLAYTPTDEERELIEGYFAHKWDLAANLSSNHPWRLFAPLASDFAGEISGQFSTTIGDGLEAQGSASADNSASLAVTEASDTVVGTGALRVRGTLAATEAADTVAGTGALRIAGSVTITEAADTVVSSGSLIGSATGAVLVTEDADTLAATGRVFKSGSVTVAEADDTSEGTAQVFIAGAVAVTEDDDTVEGSGALAIAGALSATEASDTVAATGTLAISGALNLTEANDNVASAGALIGSGSGSVILTEGDDTLAGVGALAIVGSVTVTEADDTLAGASGTRLVGTLSVLEGDDILSSTATLPVQATVSVTEAADTLAAAASRPRTGVLAATEVNDTLSAAGLRGAFTGAVAVTEANDNVAAVANLFTPRRPAVAIASGGGRRPSLNARSRPAAR